MENITYKEEKKLWAKRMRSVFSHIGLSLFAYDASAILLMYIFTRALGAVMRYFSFEKGINFLYSTEYTWLSTLMFQYIIATGIFLFIMSRKKPIAVFEKEKKTIGVKSAVIIGVVCIAIMQIGSYMSSVLSVWVELIRGNPLESELSDLIMESDIFVVTIMCVIVGPILEEVMFRKCIIDRLRPFGEGFAVICSSLIFAIAHGNFLQVFYSFGLGALLAVLYLKTNNLKICIAYHVFVNFIGSVVPMLFLRAGVESALEALSFTPAFIAYMLYMVLLFLITAVGVLIIILTYKRVKYEKSVFDRITLAEKIKAFVLNPGMILVFLTAVCSFILSF